MKKVKNLVLALASVSFIASGLSSCGGTSKVRIGFINPDTGGGETQAWGSYVSDYLTKAYSDKYEFIVSTFSSFSSTTTNHAECKSMLAKGCKAIVEIGYGDETNFTACKEKGVYYCATGSSPDTEKRLTETYKSINDHFIGALGPSLTQEAQAGYDMADYYIGTKKYTDLAVYGCVIGYAQSLGITVHAWRVAGMFKRMLEDAPDATTHYCSFYADKTENYFTKNSTIQEIETTIAGRSNVYGVDAKGNQWATGDILNIGPYKVNYWQQNVADRTANDAEEVTFTTDAKGAFNGDSNFKAQIILGSASAYSMFAGKGRCKADDSGKVDLKIAEVESFADANLTAMNSGYIDYECGKMNSCIGPAFAAVFSALNGRNFGVDANGTANLLVGSQGFWAVASTAEFTERANFDKYATHPAYSKALLDTMTYRSKEETESDGTKLAANDITREQFLTKFNACTYEEVKAAREAAEA
jgi:hypothetical protein